MAVGALGDSITAGNPLYDPDPEQRAALGFGEDPESQYEYWAAESNLDLDFVNCGVFGETTDQIAKRLPDCAEDADLLVVQGGINDIAQTLGSDPQAMNDAVAAAAANIDGTLDEAEEMGLDAAVANVLPWNNGHPDADGPIEALNAEIAEIASAATFRSSTSTVHWKPRMRQARWRRNTPTTATTPRSRATGSWASSLGGLGWASAAFMAPHGTVGRAKAPDDRRPGASADLQGHQRDNDRRARST